MATERIALPTLGEYIYLSQPATQQLTRRYAQDVREAAERSYDNADTAMTANNPARARYERSWGDRIAAGRIPNDRAHA